MVEPVPAVGVDLGQVVERLDLGVHRQADGVEELERLGVAAERGPALHRPQLVGEEAQVAAGGDLGVLLAQRPGARVAGVGEQAQPGLALALVELLEGGQGHVDLAPHLQQPGQLDAGGAVSRSGTSAMVRTFSVRSSPITPSPRVAPRT